MKAENFTVETRAIFDPIADRYRMVRHEPYAGFIEYKNNAVRLFDRLRLQPLRRGERRDRQDLPGETSYDLADILAMKGVAEADVVSRLQVSDENDQHPSELLYRVIARMAPIAVKKSFRSCRILLKRLDKWSRPNITGNWMRNEASCLK